MPPGTFFDAAMSNWVPLLFSVVVGLEVYSGRTTCRGGSDDDWPWYRRPRWVHRTEEPVWYWTLMSFQLVFLAVCWWYYFVRD